MKKTKKICWSATAAAAAMLPRAAFAAGTDALSAINNLKNLMLNLLSAVGVVLVIWGIVQVAMGFKSQDGTQKAQGILFLAGGAVIASVGSVLTVLGF